MGQKTRVDTGAGVLVGGGLCMLFGVWGPAELLLIGAGLVLIGATIIDGPVGWR